MQEIKHNWEEEFTPAATAEQVRAAIENKANREVRIHNVRSSYDEAKLRYARKLKRKAQKKARKANR